jgi:hypothetical protein
MNGYLTDQAVKLLCEIWHSKDIPSVFATSDNTLVTGTPPSDLALPVNHEIPQKSCNRSIQLPSPVSPSTRTSLCSPPSSISLPASCPDVAPIRTRHPSNHKLSKQLGANQRLRPRSPQVLSHIWGCSPNSPMLSGSHTAEESRACLSGDHGQGRQQ